MNWQGPLDKLPTWARDLIVGLVAAFAAWGLSDLVPLLQDKGGAWALLAGILPVVLGSVTTATRRYGAGRRNVVQLLDDRSEQVRKSA